jgi:four helix bundle suffix protein
METTTALQLGSGGVLFLAIGRRLRYLLGQQIARLEKDFLEKGGLKELMYKARVDYSRRQ